jgi:excisionase family DNA binding protein
MSTSNIIATAKSLPISVQPVEPMLFDVKGALVQLKISRGLLYGLMRSGRIRFVKLGNRTLFRRIDLERFLEEQVRSNSVP